MNRAMIWWSILTMLAVLAASQEDSACCVGSTGVCNSQTTPLDKENWENCLGCMQKHQDAVAGGECLVDNFGYWLETGVCSWIARTVCYEACLCRAAWCTSQKLPAIEVVLAEYHVACTECLGVGGNALWAMQTEARQRSECAGVCGCENARRCSDARRCDPPIFQIPTRRTRTRTWQTRTRSKRTRTATRRTRTKSKRTRTATKRTRTKSKQTRTATRQTRTRSKRTRTATKQTRTRSNQTRTATRQTRTKSKRTRTATRQTRTATKQTRTATKQTRTKSKRTRTATRQTKTATKQTRTATKETRTQTKQTKTHTRTFSKQTRTRTRTVQHLVLPCRWCASYQLCTTGILEIPGHPSAPCAAAVNAVLPGCFSVNIYGYVFDGVPDPECWNLVETTPECYCDEVSPSDSVSLNTRTRTASQQTRTVTRKSRTRTRTQTRRTRTRKGDSAVKPCVLCPPPNDWGFCTGGPFIVPGGRTSACVAEMNALTLPLSCFSISNGTVIFVGPEVACYPALFVAPSCSCEGGIQFESESQSPQSTHYCCEDRKSVV